MRTILSAFPTVSLFPSHRLSYFAWKDYELENRLNRIINTPRKLKK